MLHTKFDLIVPDTYSSHIPSRSTPAPKNSSSTLALSNPDIGPQSSPRARAAIIRYAPCNVLFRFAVTCQCRVVRKQVSKARIVRSELRQLLVETKVISDNHRDRRGHCLL